MVYALAYDGSVSPRHSRRYHLEMFEPKERRVDQVELIGRRKCNVPAELRDKGIRMPCHVVNISLAGAQVNIGSFSSYVPKGNQWHL